jgi:hypothetical protein
MAGGRRTNQEWTNMMDDDSVDRRCWIISVAMDDYWLLVDSCLSNSQLLARSDCKERRSPSRVTNGSAWDPTQIPIPPR